MENERVLIRAQSLRRPLALVVAALAGLAACGQEDPDPPTGSEQDQPYYPLVAGSWWDYKHTDWTERVTVSSADFNGAPAFQMSDSPDDEGVRTDSIVTSVNGRAARVTKEEYQVNPDNSETLTSSVNYGTGFTRFNEDWAKQAVGYKETPEYERIETPPGGQPEAPEARRHTFEVLALDDEVTTERGTFRCILIQRTKDWEAAEDGLDPDEAQTKRYWFARGVGKVQELNVDSGKVEQLIDYMIPVQ